jgi:signal transduction histidine kinase
MDLNELAKQTVGLLQFKSSEKKQIIELILAPEPLVVSVYKEKIARVLSNLVSNAIKFSEQNALIKVKLEKKGNAAIISVADNGIGIPKEALPFVFDSFTSAKRHGTAGETSYGLGLSICKQIIATHSGRIWVESAEGTGSTFFIELPL